MFSFGSIDILDIQGQGRLFRGQGFFRSVLYIETQTKCVDESLLGCKVSFSLSLVQLFCVFAAVVIVLLYISQVV